VSAFPTACGGECSKDITAIYQLVCGLSITKSGKPDPKSKIMMICSVGRENN